MTCWTWRRTGGIRASGDRPFAAGDLSAIAGVVVVCLLMVGALVLALALPHIFNALPGTAVLAHPYSFLEWLGLYTAVTLSYSLYLKRKLLLDVFVLSGLYTVRIMAGSAATGIPMSPWLAGFSVFFFLSLAFVKRFSELEGLRERGVSVSNGRGYFVSDLEQLRALGTGAMYAAVVVLSLYINNPETNFAVSASDAAVAGGAGVAAVAEPDVDAGQPRRDA